MNYVEELNVQLDLNFCNKDWNYVTKALEIAMQTDNFSSDELDDLRTIRLAILSAQKAVNEDKRNEISFQKAVNICRNTMRELGIDYSDLETLELFVDDVQTDEEEAAKSWTVEDVDIALSNFDHDYAQNDRVLFNIIQETVLHYEDLLAKASVN